MFYKIKISFKKVGEFLNGLVLVFHYVVVIDLDAVVEGVFGRGQIIFFWHVDITANGNRPAGYVNMVMKGLELAGRLGIPVVIMEGLLGGRLAKAPDNVQALYDAFPVKRSPVEWAFRWLCNHPEVATVLSGCNEAEQIDDNLRIFDTVESGIMSEEELKLMDDVRGAYLSRTKIGCTGCRYCMPCPNGVNIPGVFSAWNELSLYGGKAQDHWGLSRIRENGEGPDRCIACGACEAACPQHLNIIESLQTAWGEMTE